MDTYLKNLDAMSLQREVAGLAINKRIMQAFQFNPKVLRKDTEKDAPYVLLFEDSEDEDEAAETRAQHKKQLEEELSVAVDAGNQDAIHEELKRENMWIEAEKAEKKHQKQRRKHRERNRRKAIDGASGFPVAAAPVWILQVGPIFVQQGNLKPASRHLQCRQRETHRAVFTLRPHTPACRLPGAQ